MASNTLPRARSRIKIVERPAARRGAARSIIIHICGLYLRVLFCNAAGIACAPAPAERERKGQRAEEGLLRVPKKWQFSWRLAPRRGAVTDAKRHVCTIDIHT